MEVPKQLLSELTEIAKNMNTNKDEFTAEPIYIVQELKRFYGFKDGDKCVWVCENDCELVFEEEADLYAYLNSQEAQENDHTFDNFEQNFYQEEWQYVETFFSRKAASDYMLWQKHNHSQMRIWVQSARLNSEILLIQRLLNHINFQAV